MKAAIYQRIDTKMKKLFSITKLKPPSSSRLASADNMTHFGKCPACYGAQ